LQFCNKAGFTGVFGEIERRKKPLIGFSLFVHIKIPSQS